MEMPQQVPIAFSQMLEMFPNVPQDVIWMYVQRYSNDIEKCAQMLDLLCQKCAEQQSPSVLKSCTNINDVQVSPLLKSIELPSNINDTKYVQQFPFLNSPTTNELNENLNDNKAAFHNELIFSNNENAKVPNNVHSKPLEDCSSNSNRNVPTSLNISEPSPLHINVYDDEDCLHSWRPNLSVGSLCSDFFMPSPTVENFQFNANQLSNMAVNHSSESKVNPAGNSQEGWRSQNEVPDTFYHHQQFSQKQYDIDLNINHSSESKVNPAGNSQEGWKLQNEVPDTFYHQQFSQLQYDIDLNNHLHFQKSQMNNIKYEVIKTKIELGDLRESVEKLSNEFKEKEKSRSVQDIETLNDEIVQLRLECQCLCTEVDYHLQDQVLLGEVDEQCYSKSPPLNNNIAKPEKLSNPCRRHSQHGSVSNNEVHEIEKWQCPKCTFDNHPAISVCEMCHLKKPKSGKRLPYLRTPPEECFCHPKTETLPIQS